MDGAIWAIPGQRMKMGKPHRVPLSEQAVTVLREVRLLRDPEAGDLIFPGAKRGAPLSDMSLTAVLRRMERGDLTAHGFRSTFRDWAAEATNYPRELAELSLAHAKGAVEGAYQRGDLLEGRRPLMAAWGAFCCSQWAAGNVVVLRGQGAA